MRPVYMVAGGITKFAKASPKKDFRLMCKEAFDQAMGDVPDLTLQRTTMTWIIFTAMLRILLSS